jgi:hypothetical protein
MEPLKNRILFEGFLTQMVRETENYENKLTVLASARTITNIFVLSVCYYLKNELCEKTFGPVITYQI